MAFGDFAGYWVHDAGLRFEASKDLAFDRALVTYRVIHRLDGRMDDATGLRTMKSPTTCREGRVGVNGRGVLWPQPVV